MTNLLPRLTILLFSILVLSQSYTPAFSQPVNDMCMNAIVLECGVLSSGNNGNGATDQSADIGCAGIGAGMWFTFVATTTTTFITVTGVTGSNPEYGVATGSCGALVNFACTSSAPNNTKDLIFTSVIGTTYYIYTTNVIQPAVNNIIVRCIDPPTNDDCEDAIFFCGNDVVSGSTVDSTPEPSDLFACNSNAGPETTVWYSFATDGTGNPVDLTVTEQNCTTTTDGLQVTIYSGTCGDFTVVDCDASAPVYNITLTTLLPNTTYYMYIMGFDGADCGFTIQAEGAIAPCCGPELTLETSCDICDEDNFFVDIIITDLGTDPSGYVYDVGGITGMITSIGITTVGPIPNGTAVINLTGITDTDCMGQFFIDGDCTCPTTTDDMGNVVAAVEAGDDVNITCGTEVNLVATLEDVLQGNFLGYNVEDNGLTCAVTPLNPADCMDLGLSESQGSSSIPITFPFDFFGVTYNFLCISENGYISFTCQDLLDPLESPIPTAGAPGMSDPDALIALFWDDLDASNGTVCAYPITTGGQQCFVIDYDVIHDTTVPQRTVEGQIIICEDGTITTTCVNCQADTGNETAVQGIENEDGTVGFGYDGIDGVTDGDDLMNCVSYTPDFGANVPCTFVAWVTDPNDIINTTESMSLSLSVSPLETTTYFAIVDCEGLLCKDEVTITITDECCDLDLPTTVAPLVVISSESTCEQDNMTLSGGFIDLPAGMCPDGSTLEYSVDGGAWSTTLPSYDQDEAITIETRCRCVLDNTVISMEGSVTTMPGVCPECDPDISSTTAPPVIISSESTCEQDNMTLSDGVIDLPVGTCPVGSSLEYSVDGGAWTMTLPSYDQENSILVETRCVCDIDDTVISMVDEVSTNPGICPICEITEFMIDTPVCSDDNMTFTLDISWIGGPDPSISISDAGGVSFAGMDPAIDANGTLTITYTSPGSWNININDSEALCNFGPFAAGEFNCAADCNADNGTLEIKSVPGGN